MILVDSSAFIEYYRPSGSPQVRSAVAGVIEDDLVAVNGVIQVEVVAYASSQSSYAKLLCDFKVFHWLELEESDFDFATELGSSLRRKGVTLPAADLIIAASAIRSSAVLFHADSHFDVLSQHSDLKSKNLRA